MSVRHRRPLLPVIAVAALAAGVAAYLLRSPFAADPNPDLNPDSATGVAAGVDIGAGETVAVSLQELVSEFESDAAELRFVDQRSVVDNGDGVVTWIAEAESTVDAGRPLYVRDDQPVVLLPGEVPAWRDLTVGDSGPDVAQLEAGLAALGYGQAGEFTIDDNYTSATAVIVERWQADLGRPETGVVNLGDVVFGPTPARVGSVSVAVGGRVSSGPLLNLTETGRELVFEIPATSRDSLNVGDAIDGGLPDGTSLTATVLAVTPLGGGRYQVSARIDPETDASALPQGDAVPATVEWSQSVAAEAVTVPAGALIRLDHGGYAVQVVDDEAIELTLVVVGVQEGTRVQISDGLDSSQVVLLP